MNVSQTTTLLLPPDERVSCIGEHATSHGHDALSCRRLTHAGKAWRDTVAVAAGPGPCQTTLAKAY